MPGTRCCLSLPCLGLGPLFALIVAVLSALILSSQRADDGCISSALTRSVWHAIACPIDRKTLTEEEKQTSIRGKIDDRAWWFYGAL